VQSSRRKDPFRYVFVPPESCEFQLTAINGAPVASKFAAAAIIDVNKSGCKLETALNLNANVHKLQVVIQTGIAGEPMPLSGEIRWQAEAATGFRYGVRFAHDEATRERLQAELRRLAGERRIVVP